MDVSTKGGDPVPHRGQEVLPQRSVGRSVASLLSSKWVRLLAFLLPALLRSVLLSRVFFIGIALMPFRLQDGGEKACRRPW